MAPPFRQDQHQYFSLHLACGWFLWLPTGHSSGFGINWMSRSMEYGVRPIGKGQIYQASVGKRQEAPAPHPPNRVRLFAVYASKVCVLVKSPCPLWVFTLTREHESNHVRGGIIQRLALTGLDLDASCLQDLSINVSYPRPKAFGVHGNLRPLLSQEGSQWA